MTALDVDFLDPNNWVFNDAFHIYAPDGERRAQVDEEDYGFLIRWCWQLKTTRCANGRTLSYFRRAGGNRVCNRGTGIYTVYLHLEVMRRKGDVPPTARHTKVDHINRDTFDCRRANLRWATARENALNTWAAP